MKEKVSAKNGFVSYVRLVFQEKRSMFFYGLCFLPVYLLMDYLPVYLPKIVVMGVEQKWPAVKLTAYTALFVLCMFLCTWIREACRGKIECENLILVQKMRNVFTRKLLCVDYRYLEDKEFLSMQSTVKENLFGGEIGQAEESTKLWEFWEALVTWLAAVGIALVYLAYLWKLSPVLPFFVIPVLLGLLLNMKMLGRMERKWAVAGGKLWKKLDYITRRTEDFSMAKDIRLYHMSDWFLGLFSKYRDGRFFYKKKEMQSRFAANALFDSACSVFYLGLYWCIILRFRQGALRASDVLFYAGLGANLMQLFYFHIVSGITSVTKISMAYQRYQNFIQYGENTGNRDIPLQQSAPEIELQHVSFSYPGTETLVLDDLNLTIRACEKVAIVGVNGSGKTTLMKLICGLLHPTCGRILLNGRDMEEMEAEERYSWFSCAFQDIQFLPLSIRENISMSSDADNRVWDCLEKAGIKETVMSLPQRDETLMEKSINENATDFSGGQRQKLVLARALYRDAGVLILDEPTAALDALAENDIYQKYASFAEGKTSFFVSHRLSSTRFCDRILLLDGGNITEEGTHEELLDKGGMYAKMFAMQSKYYQKESGMPSAG